MFYRGNLGGLRIALIIFGEGMGLSQEDIITLKEDVSQLKAENKTLFNVVAELKGDVKDLKENFANRLPLWATTLIGILTGLCGFLAARAL